MPSTLSRIRNSNLRMAAHRSHRLSTVARSVYLRSTLWSRSYQYDLYSDPRSPNLGLRCTAYSRVRAKMARTLAEYVDHGPGLGHCGRMGDPADFDFSIGGAGSACLWARRRCELGVLPLGPRFRECLGCPHSRTTHRTALSRPA